MEGSEQECKALESALRADNFMNSLTFRPRCNPSVSGECVVHQVQQTIPSSITTTNVSLPSPKISRKKYIIGYIYRVVRCKPSFRDGTKYFAFLTTEEGGKEYFFHEDWVENKEFVDKYMKVGVSFAFIPEVSTKQYKMYTCWDAKFPFPLEELEKRDSFGRNAAILKLAGREPTLKQKRRDRSRSVSPHRMDVNRIREVRHPRNMSRDSRNERDEKEKRGSYHRNSRSSSRKPRCSRKTLDSYSRSRSRSRSQSHSRMRSHTSHTRSHHRGSHTKSYISSKSSKRRSRSPSAEAKFTRKEYELYFKMQKHLN